MLRSYSARQARVILKAQEPRVRRLAAGLPVKGGSGWREDRALLLHSVNKADREQLRLYYHLKDQADRRDVAAAKRRGARSEAKPYDNRDYTLLGLPVEAAFTGLRGKVAGTALEGGLNVAKAVLVDTPRVAVEHPGESLAATGRLARDTVAGVVSLPYQVIEQGPEAAAKKLWKGTVQDYERLYGPAARGDFALYRKRVNEQGGPLRVALDAAAVAGAAAKAAGLAGKAGALGPGARRFLQEPRARKLVSSGLSVAQRDETARMAPNPVRVAAQRTIDRRRDTRLARQDTRAAKARRRAAAQGESHVPGGRRFVRPKAAPTLSDAHAREVAKASGRLVVKRGQVRAIEFPREAVKSPRFEVLQASLERAGFQFRSNIAGGRTAYAVREVVAGRRMTHRGQVRDVAGLRGRAVNEIRTATGREQASFRASTRGLSKPEQQAAFYAHTGLVIPDSPAKSVRLLERRREQIIAERAGAKPDRFQGDELRTIGYLIDHAQEAFTPRLAQALEGRPGGRVRRGAEGLRAQVRRGERQHPYMPASQQVRATYGPQAEFLGVGPREISQGAARAEALTRSADRLEGEASRLRAAGRERAASERLVLASRAREEARVVARPALESAVDAVARHERRAGGAPSLAIRQPSGHGLDAATFEDLGKAMGLKQREQAQAEKLVNAQTKGAVEAVHVESGAAFARRVKEAADREGLPAPAFAPSERFAEPKLSQYTAGGQRAPAIVKRRTYANQRRGVQRTDPQVIYDGIQRNVKARITGRLVADLYDRHAHPTYRDMTLSELKAAIEREGYDPSEVAIVFPGMARDTLRAQEGQALAAGREAVNEAEIGDLDRLAQAVEGSAVLLDGRGPRGLNMRRGDYQGAMATVEDLAALAEDPRYRTVKGALYPRGAYDELFNSVKGETALGRAIEKMKTVQSKLVLGPGNVNWVISDAIGNAAVMAFAGGVGPVTFLKAQAWFRGLDDVTKARLEDLVDVGMQRSNVHRPKMGSTVNSRLANTWRALRQTPLGKEHSPLMRAASQVLGRHPINVVVDGWFSLERTVANDPFRRAYLYKLTRSEAFRELDAKAGKLNATLERMQGTLTLGPRDRMAKIARDRRQMEDLARQVNDILGDWSTFTNAERRLIGRALFFYPYLRYSLRLVAYTLPVHHTIRLAVLANLAALSAREQQELVGATKQDWPLMLGRYFFKRDGVVWEYSARTLNPAGNVFTESEGSEEYLQLLPPAATVALGQILKTDLYRNKPWRTGGKARGGPTDLITRGRILAAEVLQLPVATRELQNYFLPGEQGNDSLFWDPRPTSFKDPKWQKQAQEKYAREKSASLWEQFLRDQLRVLRARKSNVPDALKRRHERDAKPKAATDPLAEAMGVGGGGSSSSSGGDKALEQAMGLAK